MSPRVPLCSLSMAAEPGGALAQPSGSQTLEHLQMCVFKLDLLVMTAQIDGLDRKVVGLTYRLGRHCKGVAWHLMDLLADIVRIARNPLHQGSSIARGMLVIGKPAVGKTTLLREMALILADEMG